MNKAWLSTFAALNDPFESKATFVDKYDLQQRTGASESLIELMNFVLVYLNNKYAILSMTKNSYDCMPMWAHYANNHRGFCIEYELDTTKYEQPDTMCEIKEMSYSLKRKSVASFIIDQMHFYEKMKLTDFKEPSENEKNKIVDALKRAQWDNFFSKHLSWNYENKFRIVYTAVPHGDFPHGDSKQIKRNLLEVNKRLSDFQSQKGILVDVSEIGLTIKTVYVGMNCDAEHEKLLNRISNALSCGNAKKISCIAGTEEFGIALTEIIGY